MTRREPVVPLPWEILSVYQVSDMLIWSRARISADLDRKAHLAAARLGRVRILGHHEGGANQFAHIVDRRAANVLEGQVVDQQARAVALENTA